MADKPNLLVLGQVTDRMLERFTAGYTVHQQADQSDPDAWLTDHGASITAVSTDGHAGLRSAPIDRLPNLKVVASFGVGYDAIPVAEAVARGVLVSHTPDVLNNEVADTAMLLWLAAAKRLVPADSWARSGAWEREGAFPLTHSVRNRTVGIVGLGRIGQTIAELSTAFGAQILYHARSAKDVPYEYCPDLIDMARRSEVLIVITPGGPETRHLVNAPVLDALGPEGLLINVSRGTVVDETALVEALQSGRLGGAGLDVFEDEPRIPDALKAMENVVLAPHIGSATEETRAAMGALVCDNLEQFLKDGTLVTPIPECRPLIAPS